jgi:ferritin-like metal-binding protein YciE
MQITIFRDLYLAELQELRDMKRQLTSAHERFGAAAASQRLAGIFNQHREETREQVERLEGLLRQHKADPQAHTDQAMEALVRESEKMLSVIPKGELRDAALIASAQKIAHYEIAAFGSAAALAGQQDLRDDQTMLHGFAEQEKKTDAMLTQLAKGAINGGAAKAA